MNADHDGAAGETTDIAVVGAGPAGLAAALEADRWGSRVTLIDERPTLGGQIFRQPAPLLGARAAPKPALERHRGEALIRALGATGVRQLTSTEVLDVDTGALPTLRCVRDDRVFELRARQLILAPGAYDRAVALPGWTLPGVFTAGGAQALVKAHGVRPAGTTVVAGSGPLVFVFAAQLLSWGVRVIAVAEAAPRPPLRRVASLLYRGLAVPHNLALGVRSLTGLLAFGVPIDCQSVATRVLGSGRVSAVVLKRLDDNGRPRDDTSMTFATESVCLGYGFESSRELAHLCGCEEDVDPRTGTRLPRRNEYCELSRSGLFLVGDGFFVRGSTVAEAEGRIAGLAASYNLRRAGDRVFAVRLRQLRARLALQLGFYEALTALYPTAVRCDQLADAETVVCRCEDVTKRQLLEAVETLQPTAADASAVKALTRAGMGLCQGRICSANVYELVARGAKARPTEVRHFSSRPPARPVRLAALARFEDYEGRDADLPDDPDCAV
jgi:thioredoxin reductase